MTHSELVALIRKLRPTFLEHLAPSELNDLLGIAQQRAFLANSVITNQGHPASHFYLVLSGGARSFVLTQAGQKMHLHWYPAGDVFGGMALVSRPSTYIASTEAVASSRVLIWERDSIRKLATQYPKLLDNALSIASDYMNLAIATQVSLTSHTARQRLALVLANLAIGVGHKVSGGIELNVRNEDLASAANITTFTASRIMSEWERARIVRKGRGRVLIPSPERLLFQEIE
jgi:CRP-like cAMP-binding protein